MPQANYFDLQVNGYAGVDFNGDSYREEDLALACARLRADGVARILATIITDEIPTMIRRLARLAASRQQDAEIAQMIAGFHIEGPFLNPEPGYIGAHPARAARPASVDQMRRLLDACQGLARVVTLAPECDPQLQTTRFLADQGICVSAGHCNPTVAQLHAAIDAGLRMFTHLGNGCPLLLHRHDNVIQRVLSLADQLWIGLIADGVHVPFPALGNYLRCAGIDRCFVVTDAISAAGLGPGTFQLGAQTVVVDENLATWAPDKSHLMGSASTMPRLVQNLTEGLQLSPAEVADLTSRNPARALQH
jgi:N-acetylglucosamine-6-phosphate deacetylase